MRTPVQVLVIPFRKSAGGTVEFCAFRRSDGDYWQFIAGGVEDGESPDDAARREAAEEAGIPAGAALHPLDSRATVPVTAFPADTERWLSAGIYYSLEHAFAVEASGVPIRLSAEHTEHRWGTREEIEPLLRFDSNRNALWELCERLRRGAI